MAAKDRVAGAGGATAAVGLTFKGKPCWGALAAVSQGNARFLGGRKLAPNFQTANSRSRLAPMQECSLFCRHFFTHLQIARASASLLYKTAHMLEHF
jgi:hypothetical protein